MWFPSPHGDKFQPIRRVIREEIVDTFPSPHGDKFQQRTNDVFGKGNGFRPLTGINFNDKYAISAFFGGRFRPLTGINFNGAGLRQFYQSGKRFRPLTGINFNLVLDCETATLPLFPSPHGDKFQPATTSALLACLRFRPLTGINFNMKKYAEILKDIAFPSPHGDKFQRAGRLECVST